MVREEGLLVEFSLGFSQKRDHFRMVGEASKMSVPAPPHPSVMDCSCLSLVPTFPEPPRNCLSMSSVRADSVGLVP